MIDPHEPLPPALRASIERNTQALERALAVILPAAAKSLLEAFPKEDNR